LFPIDHGMLYFTGFTVIEPFLVHAPARMTEPERTAELRSLSRARACAQFGTDHRLSEAWRLRRAICVEGGLSSDDAQPTASSNRAFRRGAAKSRKARSFKGRSP